MAKLKFGKTCPWRMPDGALAHFDAGQECEVADTVAAEIIQAGYADPLIEQIVEPAPKKGKAAPVEGGV